MRVLIEAEVIKRYKNDRKEAILLVKLDTGFGDPEMLIPENKTIESPQKED